MNYLCQKCNKKLGVADLVSEIKRVENYPNFEKSVHVIQHDLQGFIVLNIYGDSKKASDVEVSPLGT